MDEMFLSRRMHESVPITNQHTSGRERATGPCSCGTQFNVHSAFHSQSKVNRWMWFVEMRSDGRLLRPWVHREPARFYYTQAFSFCSRTTRCAKAKNDALPPFGTSFALTAQIS